MEHNLFHTHRSLAGQLYEVAHFLFSPLSLASDSFSRLFRYEVFTTFLPYAMNLVHIAIEFKSDFRYSSGLFDSHVDYAMDVVI